MKHSLLENEFLSNLGLNKDLLSFLHRMPLNYLQLCRQQWKRLQIFCVKLNCFEMKVKMDYPSFLSQHHENSKIHSNESTSSSSLFLPTVFLWKTHQPLMSWDHFIMPCDKETTKFLLKNTEIRRKTLTMWVVTLSPFICIVLFIFISFVYMKFRDFRKMSSS